MAFPGEAKCEVSADAIYAAVRKRTLIGLSRCRWLHRALPARRDWPHNVVLLRRPIKERVSEQIFDAFHIDRIVY
jgi:hypothetical protein